MQTLVTYILLTVGSSINGERYQFEFKKNAAEGRDSLLNSKTAILEIPKLLGA